MKKQALITVLAMTIIIGCSKSNNSADTTTATPVTCTGTKSFTADVFPIIQSVCAASGCHNTGSTNGPGPLTNYQQVFNSRSIIRSAVSTGLMPQNSTLSSSEKSAIICWIDAGAINN